MGAKESCWRTCSGCAEGFESIPAIVQKIDEVEEVGGDGGAGSDETRSESCASTSWRSVVVVIAS